MADIEAIPVNHSLEAITAQRFNNGQQNKTPNPVGAIVYAHGRKIIWVGELGENGNTVLKCTYQDTPPNFDPKVYSWSGRVVDLSSYDEVMTAQVGFADAQINLFESVYTSPTISARLGTVDPLTGTRGEVITVDEDHLLRIFTGELGGIAVFRGANLPEEIALLMERRTPAQKAGVAFFMRPEKSAWGFDSVRGFYGFLRQLNSELTEASFPEQTQALADLRYTLEHSGLRLSDLRVREEILRTQIIANVRLLRKTGDTKYQEFLDAHLIRKPRGIRSLAYLFERPNPALPQIIQQSIDRLFISGGTTEELKEIQGFLPPKKDIEDPNTETEAELWRDHRQFLESLKTTTIVELWRQVGLGYKDPNSLVFKQLLYQLDQKAAFPGLEDDIIRSLDRIRKAHSGFTLITIGNSPMKHSIGGVINDISGKILK